MAKKTPIKPGDDYSVGYAKPPCNTRFEKGQSGNPNGRPVGSKNVNTVLRRAANEKVTITENGKQKRITKLEAAAKQLVNRAASGDHRAISLLLPHLAAIDASLATDLPLDLDSNDQEVMTTLFERFTAQDGDVIAPAKPPSSRARRPKKSQVKGDSQ